GTMAARSDAIVRERCFSPPETLRKVPYTRHGFAFHQPDAVRRLMEEAGSTTSRSAPARRRSASSGAPSGRGSCAVATVWFPPSPRPVLRGRMPRSRRLLCLVYRATALLAFVGTWHQNLAYSRADEGPLAGFVGATGRFWPATLATPASTSITVDIALFFLAAAVFMVIEARRLDVRFVWLYVLL